MAIFVKQNGQWRQIDTPYIKKDGDWILPEEGYIKENGEWKLIFDQFEFVVETVDHSETQEAAVLTGQLTAFEDFGEAGYFQQNLTESLAAPAVAVSQAQRRIAVGGIDDSVYLYDLNLNFIGELIEPTEDVSSIDIHDDTGDIAVSDLGGTTYIYDSDFNLTTQINYPTGNPLSLDYNQGTTTGRLVIGGEDNTAYIYDGSYNQINTVSFPDTIRSVDFRTSDGWLAVGGDNPNVRIFDNSFTFDQAVNTNHEGTTKAAFGDANDKLGVLDEQRVHIYTNNFTKQYDLTDGGGGPIGDIAWDGTGRIAHASQDDFVYVYDNTGTLISVFDDAQRDYQSIDWDPEQLLIAGTLEQNAGDAYVYSTAVTGFFEVDEGGTGLDASDRVRQGPLLSLGQYDYELDGLQPGVTYDFRAGAEGNEGRTALGETLSFTAPNLTVQTNPVNSQNVGPVTADISGEVTSFDRPTRLPAVSIEWGETGQGFPNEINLGSSDTTFGTTLSGLNTNTQYEFRAKAQFGGVSQTGATEVFTTENVQINLDTLAATNVQEESADLRGEITDIIGASSTDTFFEYREVGNQNFNRLPTTGFETVNDSQTPATVTLNLSGIQSNTQYEYRFRTDTSFDGGLEQFTTAAFNITIDSAGWSLRGGAFNGGENLTFGDSVDLTAQISGFGGQSFNYEVREKISGTDQGAVASGSQSGSTLNLSWNVGDSFTEGDATDSDTIEYELFVDTTIDGASSNDNATVSGNYVESPKIGVQQSVTINAQEGSFTDRDIDVSETSQLDTLSLNNISIDNDTSDNFSLQSTTSETVSANTTEQITVRYSPPVGSSGTDTADLTFDHNAKNESSPLTVDLTGQVNVVTSAALASGQSSTVTFNNTFVTNDSDTTTISITETSGSGSYSINSITLSGADSGDFNVVNATVPSSVDDNGASFDVEFVPNSRGSKNATVEIDHDADNPTGNLTVDVSGTAEQETTVSVPDITITSDADGNESIGTVTISETGQDFDATNIAVSEASNQPSGTETNLFDIKQGTVPGTVTAGSSAGFDVGFDPLAVDDDQDYRINVQFDGTDVGGSFTNTQQIIVTGDAGGTPDIVIPNIPSFNDTFVNGGTDTQTVTVENQGSAPASNLSAAITNNSTGEFSITNNTTLDSNLGAGQQDTIDIEFDPSQRGTRTATFEANADTTSDSGQLTAEGIVAANLVAIEFDGISSNDVFTYSDTTVGSTDFDTATVENQGDVDATSVTVITPSSSPFYIDQGGTTRTESKADIAPTIVTSVGVHFVPSTSGDFSGANIDVEYEDGNPNTGTQTVSIPVTNATAIAQPTASVTPTSETFPDTDVGSSSSTTTFTIQPSTVDYDVSSISIGGTDSDDYNIVSQPSTPVTISSGGSGETVEVEFTPQTGGTQNDATLDIAHDASGNSSPISADLNGTGLVADVSDVTYNNFTADGPGASPPGTGTSSQEAITLEAGGGSVDITSVQTIGVTSQSINSIQSTLQETTPINPTQGQTLTVDTQVQTSGLNGGNPVQATLEVQYTNGAGVSNTLTDNYEIDIDAQSIADISPNSLSFGSGSSDETQQVTIANNGDDTYENVDYTITNVSITGDSSAFTTDISSGTGISPSASLLGNVTFERGSLSDGNYSATLTIEHDAEDETEAADASPVDVSLSGEVSTTTFTFETINSSYVIDGSGNADVTVSWNGGILPFDLDVFNDTQGLSVTSQQDAITTGPPPITVNISDSITQGGDSVTVTLTDDNGNVASGTLTATQFN